MLTVAAMSLPGGPVGFLFAPPFDVGYYAACAISRIHPDAGIRPIVGYILALLFGLIFIILVPWFLIGFLQPAPSRRTLGQRRQFQSMIASWGNVSRHANQLDVRFGEAQYDY